MVESWPQQTKADIEALKESGDAVPTIGAALENKGDFEHLKDEIARIAQTNPEDLRKLDDALKQVEQRLDSDDDISLTTTILMSIGANMQGVVGALVMGIASFFSDAVEKAQMRKQIAELREEIAKPFYSREAS